MRCAAAVATAGKTGDMMRRFLVAAGTPWAARHIASAIVSSARPAGALVPRLVLRRRQIAIARTAATSAAQTLAHSRGGDSGGQAGTAADAAAGAPPPPNFDSILRDALELVPAKGWSVDAIAAVLPSHGLSAAGHGVFRHGGFDIVAFAMDEVRTCASSVRASTSHPRGDGEIVFGIFFRRVRACARAAASGRGETCGCGGGGMQWENGGATQTLAASVLVAFVF